MSMLFGINTGFAINRFVEPEDWTRIVAEELGLSVVQFTADLLNPWYPEKIVYQQAEKIRNACEKYNIWIQTSFTSQFTRVNHLLHPDDDIRNAWLDWFKRFFKLSVFLGAEGSGSHFGILTVHDNADSNIRQKRIHKGVECWRNLSEYGAEIGLKYLLWEPMSISREIGETISSAEEIQNLCKVNFSIPMTLCFDVDHGDVSSPNPDDTNPYVWIEHFGGEIKVLHLKQSLQDKGGHYPFTDEYNVNGKIFPEKIISTIKKAGINSISLILEISHRERYPFEQRVLSDLKKSVEYWKPFI
ncbi:MAG TPA: TIM barrel protein [Candidatus Hydrogenedens sp.]|nr:TIM barrel protein [Candidatus Hydrogenedens sp.]HOL19724.1 TIM barrel protein [Candidatus Hydrogenedens sp.]HPP58747.1 TIM barrel protein [Candidatus Hydrogenedens sp.]